MPVAVEWLSLDKLPQEQNQPKPNTHPNQKTKGTKKPTKTTNRLSLKKIRD
jgi:hypothetical protein